MYLQLYYWVRSARNLCFWCVGLGACWYLWGCRLNPWFWFCTWLHGLYLCHVFLLLTSICGRDWIIPLPPPCPKPTPRFSAGWLGISPVLKSLDSGSPIRISWPELHLELLQWVRGFFLFPRKGKKFSRIILSTPANAYHMYQVKHCRNIHSDWIARTTAV